MGKTKIYYYDKNTNFETYHSIVKNFKGVFLVLLGAVCFSVKAIIIKLAYGISIDPVTLLTLRMGFSLPFFLAVPFIYKRKSHEQKVTRQDWIKILLLGILGYYVASIFDFWGLQYITAGLERLILFIYPTIVVLLSAAFLKKPITKHTIFALLLSYLGVFIIFSDTNIHSQKNLVLGAVFIFISAFSYAVYLVGSGSLIPKLGSVLFNAYSMVISCLAVIVHFSIAQPTNLLELPQEFYLFGITIALVSTVIPTFLVAEGINLIGPGKASIIASVGPVITIFLGYWILGETFTFYEGIGTLFVLGGVIWISTKK